MDMGRWDVLQRIACSLGSRSADYCSLSIGHCELTIERPLGDYGDVDGDDDGGEETDAEESPLRSGFFGAGSGCKGSDVTGEGAEVDVEQCAWEHADPGGEKVAAELHPRQSERVVEKVVGEDGGEAQEEDDLGPFLADRFVEGAEAWPAFGFLRDPVAREVATDEKGKRSPGHGTKGDKGGAFERTKEKARCHRDEKAGKEEHGRRDVEAHEGDGREARVEGLDILKTLHEGVFEGSAHPAEGTAQPRPTQ